MGRHRHSTEELIQRAIETIDPNAGMRNTFGENCITENEAGRVAILSVVEEHLKSLGRDRYNERMDRIRDALDDMVDSNEEQAN